MFILAQFLGAIALVSIAISFQKNDKKALLKYQICASVFFALQYLCLEAITGFLMNIVTIIRNLIFRNNQKTSVKYLIVIIVVILLITAMAYDGPISLLPSVAVIVYSIAVWQNNLKVTRLLEVISCLIFFVYNINVLAISGIVSNVIELSATLIAIYRFDIKK